MFSNSYKNLKIFVTGHTGFKGSWLVLWLLKSGARVCGYSLLPPTQPNHYDILKPDIESYIGDIRDLDKLSSSVEFFRPDAVFHLAAQPFVRKSYRDPIETFESNVMGTANILEACRKTDSVRSVVIVTSDKCYENREWVWGYRENDPMGGYDPYSASKGCAELVTASYRNSFFHPDAYQKTHQTLVASVRAGNVIGGGDWGEDRLVPDIMRAANHNEKVIIRNPQAVRPWQHVLEPLSGYLLLGQQLMEGKKEFAGAWNFGPDDDGHIPVIAMVKNLQARWKNIDFEIIHDNNTPHEANMLKLDCSKARSLLGWKPVWNSAAMLEKTAAWYREFYESGRVISQEQLTEYIEDAKQKEPGRTAP